MTVAITPEIEALLKADAPVAIGVSGGKDSCAVSFATMRHLHRINHKGPRILIHADLGVTEWADSGPTCQRLADRLGLELVVVKRKQGDMMDRWEQRWHDNLKRWTELSCVKIILPWSTPSMRFCTSELKVDQICRDLVKRYPGTTIINVTGIRREESTERSKALTSKPQPKLTSITQKTTGMDWLPIADWKIADVWDEMRKENFSPHEAYVTFGSSRVSCVWCILATVNDHMAGARDPRNHDLGRRMVDLEIKSTFAFQGDRWLGDTISDLLSEEQRRMLMKAKAWGKVRETAEGAIPKHLLYVKGWPTVLPTVEEANLLAGVRMQVAAALRLSPTFVNGEDVRARYQQLLDEKERRS